MKSNETCFYYIRRMPEIILSYKYAIYEVCVRNIGDKTSAFNSQYRINAYMLYRIGKLLIGLRPLTIGVRLLSIDGKGTLGVIAIEFIDILQSILGNI